MKKNNNESEMIDDSMASLGDGGDSMAEIDDVENNKPTQNAS